MPLTIHHLQVSQSERLPWLAEELSIPYTLVLHQRSPYFSPQSIKDLNPLGQAPVIQDGDVTLSESGACVEYVIHKYGNGRLALPPDHKHYADYLYWFHFSNSNLQSLVMRILQFQRTGEPEAARGTPGAYATQLPQRLKDVMTVMNDRLATNEWLAGDDFTAADIMTVWTFTTMRTFWQEDLSAYAHVLAYLKRCVERDGYKKARAKADPALMNESMVEGKPPKPYAERLKEQEKM